MIRIYEKKKYVCMYLNDHFHVSIGHQLMGQVGQLMQRNDGQIKGLTVFGKRPIEAFDESPFALGIKQ